MDHASLLPIEDDIRFFNENGFWVSKKLFDDTLLDQALAHMEMIYRGEYEKGEAPLSNYIPSQESTKGLRKTDNAWWADRTMESIATAPILGEIAATLLRVPHIHLWHDQMLYKPGQSEAFGNVGWHQDKHYWASASGLDMVTAWVAFDDVDEENGAMRFVPGSNHWGLLDENDFFNPDMTSQRKRMNIPSGAKWEEFVCNLSRGCVSFHHCMTLHGSGPNTSVRLRRSMAVHLMSGDTALVEGKGHDNERLLKSQPGFDTATTGTLYRGPRFPQLYPAG